MTTIVSSGVLQITQKRGNLFKKVRFIDVNVFIDFVSATDQTCKNKRGSFFYNITIKYDSYLCYWIN